MFYITGKPTLLEAGAEVYVHHNVLFKFHIRFKFEYFLFV